MRTIHPDIFPIRSIATNCYLLKSTQGMLLIDTGMKGGLKTILKTITAQGKSSIAMKYILITHADADHYGNLASLQRIAPQVPACTSQPEAQAITNGTMSRDLILEGFQKSLYNLSSDLFNSTPAKISHLISAGNSFPWLGKLVVIDSRGHTPGHLSYYSESTGILFAGDSILVHGGELLPAHGANCWDEDLAEEAFSRQLALKPVAIYGGHGIWQK